MSIAETSKTVERPELLLAIDCGTQSVRALLFDLSGNLVGRAQEALTGYRVPQPGWLEHDGEGFWQATASCCQALWARDPLWREAVRGVAVTTQRASIMPVDRDGRCRYPAIIWLDQRRASQVPPVKPMWQLLFTLAGQASNVRHFQREAELNWLAQHEPALHASTHKFLLVSGLLNHRLTGRFADSIGSLVAYLPFDFKQHRWAAAADWKWQAVAVRPEQLPDLLPVGSVLGEVTAAASAATGIRAGTPVIAAAADKACEILGSGVVTPTTGALSYGTTATINVTSPRYFEATAGVPAYPAATPGQFSCEVQIFRGYWMVNWFKEQFGHAERAAAETLGVAPETLFDEMVGTVPPGSMGLMLQPYWSPGVRQPGPDAKGAVIGFGDVHTRAHLYRAILEGLAYALREGRERIEKRGRLRLSELRVSGGGSQSDAALQLTADIFNLPTARPHTHETSGLGAAIDCAVGLGLHADFNQAVAGMTRVGRLFEPVAANVAVYDALYERVYRHMYARLEPLYTEIRRITGYPGFD
jgi:sugar (pentulose or hexulose) kinase